MTLVKQWEASFADGLYHAFSPSGHALVLQSLHQELFMETFEVRFADDREPLLINNESPITPLAWASDEELVYRVWGEPLGKKSAPWLWVLAVASGESRPLIEASDTMSVIYSGRTGHLSVLSEPQGRSGLFDLDVITGTLRRLPVFDPALERLEIYPLFGHAFCDSHQEAAVVAWPLGDYLPEGIEPTTSNSQWSSVLNHPVIQNYVEVLPDGTTITQRELTREAKRKTPPRLFVLDASGGFQEVPNSHKAHRPLWSPDSTTLSFERSDHFDPRSHPGSCGSVMLVRRDDLTLMRLGGCGVNTSTIMHPADVLFCQLEDESIPATADCGLARSRSSRWKGFDLRGGDVTPTNQR